MAEYSYTRTASDIVAPVLNLNGTPGERLIDDFLEAGQAINTAIKKVEDTAPNGRDYQTASTGQYEKAKAQHDSVLKALARMSKMYYDLAELVQDSLDERAR